MDNQTRDKISHFDTLPEKTLNTQSSGLLPLDCELKTCLITDIDNQIQLGPKK